MKIRDKLFYGLTMLSLLPIPVLAEEVSSGLEGGFIDSIIYYGGLVFRGGQLRVGTNIKLEDVTMAESNTSPLQSFVDASNGIITFGKVLVTIGIVLAMISVVYSGIQYANSFKSVKKEEAKMRLMYSVIGAALLGGIGLLVNFSFNLF